MMISPLSLAQWFLGNPDYEIEKSIMRFIETGFSSPRVSPESRRKRVILIIDDNLDFTHAARRALEETGRYCVCEEHDPTRAFETARERMPDLILLDSTLPHTDGGEVAVRLQADPALRQTPLVYLTGHFDGVATDRENHLAVARETSFPELIEAIEQKLPALATS